MTHALLLYADAEAAASTTPAEAMAELERYGEITDELEAAGVHIGGEAFLPASEATDVRRSQGVVRTAPSSSSDPELSGFYLVDCDEDRAIEIAGRLPVVDHGYVEVRPLMDLPG